MAIEYHEGLPGAGKSYEAVVFHIIPAIKERRTVVSNIRGLNVERIAELSGQSVELVKLLIINIEPAEQDSESSEIQRCINEMCNQTPDNALIVWDEIQDYFPSGNYKLPHNQQKFWTEHRHRGLDIIVMGQDRGDCHKIIRNRIRTVIYFLKLEVIGKPNRYKWEIYQKQNFGRFVKTGSGTREYEKQFFGTYMSVRREGVQKKVYQTSRTNMLAGSPGLIFGVPGAFALAIFSIWHLWGFFHPEPKTPSTAVKIERPAPAITNPPPEQLNSVPAPPVVTAQAPAAKPEPVPIDYFDRLTSEYQVRASAIITSQKPGKEVMGRIELLDDTYHVKEVFTVQEIQALGWIVTATGYGLLLEKQDVAHVARAWPIDVYGEVDRHTLTALGTAGSEAPAGAQGGPSTGTRIVHIPDTEYSSRPWR
ncbi:MAG: zonular occludens toxin domain-containing protein [Gammaproteobacteria bacterium]